MHITIESREVDIYLNFLRTSLHVNCRNRAMDKMVLKKTHCQDSEKGRIPSLQN
jgi:hypothetical protein